LEKEKISVILPVWKPDLKQLELCLKSLIDQTYENIEIVISYRKSGNLDSEFHELIRKFNDSRIKIVESDLQGFTNALNEGIQNTTGKLIARIDADDYCDITRFEKQLEFKRKTNSDIVGSWAYSISHFGEKIGKIELPVTHNQIRKNMMLHCPLLHPSLLLDKKIFSEIGTYDPLFIHAEDYEFYFRAMSKNYKFGNVPEYLVYIREDPHSRSRGVEWKTQRKYYMKSKNLAFFKYGFRNFYDVFYYLFSPISYFISPKIAYRIKRFTGWYKTN